MTVVQLFLAWSFVFDSYTSSEAFEFITIVYTIQAYFFNRYTRRLSPKACRYLTPDWDFIEPGEPLYPSVFYIF